jgi:hypothetical protein
VRNIDIAQSGTPRALGVDQTNVPDSDASFTPGDFFKDAGTLIAVCLGLGLLMRILLG